MGEDLYLLQLLCLCLTLAVCFQFHVTKAMHAPADTTFKHPENRARFYLFIKSCSYVFAAWFPYSPRGLKRSLELERFCLRCTVKEPQVCARRQCLGQGSSAAQAQLEQDLLQAACRDLPGIAGRRLSLLLDMLHVASIVKKAIIGCWVYKCGRHRALLWRSHLGASWHAPTWQPSMNNHAGCKALRKGGSRVKPPQ